MNGNNIEIFDDHSCLISKALKGVGREKMDVLVISGIKLASFEHVTLRGLNVQASVFCHVLLACAHKLYRIRDVCKNILSDDSVKFFW